MNGGGRGGRSMPKIRWREGDVRELMEEFTPRVSDLPYGEGVWGRRGGVVCSARWKRSPKGLRSEVYCNGRKRRFCDPIEAISYAFSLARKEGW